LRNKEVDVLHNANFTEPRDSEEEPLGLYFATLEKDRGIPGRQCE